MKSELDQDGVDSQKRHGVTPTAQSVGRAVARGAAWTTTIHFISRALAVVSTLILARLLTPADFGLYALGMSAYAFIELLGAFGFAVVLIQNQAATDEHYNTAWTLNFIFSCLCATTLYLVAPLAADLLRDNNLIAILRFCCLLFLVDAVKNNGIVNFRKEMVFDREFKLRISVKLTGFLVTVPIAFLTRSYWAMLSGLLASSIMLVILSYVMHPFRPRFSLVKWREMLAFSSWLQLNNIIGYGSRHSGRFFLLRSSGVDAVGSLQVARELGTILLEIVKPINRAAFPGYAKVNKDPRAMSELYYDVQGMLMLVGVPLSAGMFMLAHLFVPLLLGEKWLPIVWLVQLFSVQTLLSVFSGSINQLLVACGKVNWATSLMILRLGLFLSALIVLVPEHSAAGVIYSRLFTWGMTIFVAFYLLRLAIGIDFFRVIFLLHRPLLATAVMCVAISVLGFQYTTGGPFLPQFGRVVVCVVVGAVVYGGVLLALWLAAGRPFGAERTLLRLIEERSGLPFFVALQGKRGQLRVRRSSTPSDKKAPGTGRRSGTTKR